MTDEMTPARLAEIKATAKQHRPGTDYAEHVPALIAEVERLRKENEGARRAAASFKAWDLAGDVDRLTRELEAAEARATAAEAKLAEAEERAVKAVIALGEIARAVMKEVEPTMGERMRCVRLARAFLASPDEEKSDA